MCPLTDDPNDPALQVPSSPGQQNDTYLVLSEEEVSKGFIRPFRQAYIHGACQQKTTMGRRLCETYARDPKFYGETWCGMCRAHFPVQEFVWAEDGKVVGS
jgi:hypothetical protein